jgi:osmoprotectant transport system permease protein
MLDLWMTGEFWDQTVTFLSLVLGSLGMALLVGIPFGILLTRLPRASGPVLAALGLLQTFPSLALLGLLIPVIGLGQPAAIFLAVIYSLFPVVLNTHVGVTQVPAAIRDAARGMGMTEGQILRRVELPLALPVILAGVRTGAVYAIGIVTICALAGAGGLGDYIIRGTDQSNNRLLMAGAIPLLLLTLLVFWGLGAVAWVSRRRSQLGLVLGGGLIALLSALGVWVIGVQVYRQQMRAQGPSAGERGEIVVGAKNFVEGEILAEILKQMLEAHTDLRVKIVHNLTPALIFKGLKTNDIQLYPEYTGVLLTNKEALDLPIPGDRTTITAVVRKEILKRHGLVLLKTFGLNNTYVLCTTRALAKKHALRTIGDLRRLSEARMVVDLSFLDRQDGWKGLSKAYGLELPEPRIMAPNLRYRALEQGDADIVLGFATDWEIAFYDLVVLEDDQDYFPSYHGAPLMRADVLERHPEIGRVLNRLHNRIDDDTMRRLNSQVARERRPEAAVAREFLLKQGLLQGPSAGERGEIVVGAKNFIEGEILAEVVKQMLETHTDLRVKVVHNLTPALIFKGLKANDIQLYPEYTGVLLTNKEALDLPIPEDRTTITALVRKEILRRHGLVLLKTFGLNNTYVLCTTRALAKKHALRTIGDLRRLSEARMVVDLSFLDRQDGWKGLSKAYGLELLRPRLMAPNLRYRALEQGDADVVLGFATDWEIAFYNLVVLEDDRHYFPSYHGALLVRGDLLKRHPEIARVLNRLHNRIDDKTMRRLNYQVARERRPEAAVAREFLLKQGLLP